MHHPQKKKNQLKKPGWRPPNWAFACVWTYLYSTMGYASYRVWVELDKPDLLAPASLPSPLKLFILQILLNWLWTPIFFGLKQITMTCSALGKTDAEAMVETSCHNEQNLQEEGSAL
nr:translocator protein-like [Cherax quadricarinatus]